jgi:two-component system chemotaxis response regulator CheY
MSKTVLVVEDDDLVRHGLAENLKEKGITVLEAADGKAGLETALANKPDLIVTDVRMPEMDGLAMLEQLRQDEWGKGVPVIVLTTDEATASINQALEAGVTAYLPKLDLEPQAITEQILVALG